MRFLRHTNIILLSRQIVVVSTKYGSRGASATGICDDDNCDKDKVECVMQNGRVCRIRRGDGERGDERWKKDEEISRIK